MMTDDLEDEAHLWSFDERLKHMRRYLNAMGTRLVPEINIRQCRDSNVLWRILVLYQCLIRRTMELTDGTERAWQSREYLVAVALARMLIETAAFVWDVTSGIEERITKADLAEIAAFVDSRVHATRMDEWVGGGLHTAMSIMTLIDRVDRDVAREAGESPKQQVIRSHYELLSEFVHPNCLGVSILYGTQQHDAQTMRFGLSEERRERLSRTLAVSLEAIGLMQQCLIRLDMFVGPLEALNKQFAKNKSLSN
jgi:hypothetical protein